MSNACETVGTSASAQDELAVRKPENIFDKVVVSFYSIVCFVMSILLVVIISCATIMRYVLEMDLYGYEEWIKIFAFWLYFMGAGYGAFAGTHVSADLIQSYMKESMLKRLIIFIRTLVTLGITLLFTWYGYDFFMFGFTGPLGTDVAIPRSVKKHKTQKNEYLSIFLGLLSMSYYFFWDMIRAGKALIKGGQEA